MTPAERTELAARTLPAFSMTAAITYFIVMGFGVATFIYYPQVGEWHLTRHADIGPPMLFYGWLVDAALAGLAAAGVTAALPRRVSLMLVGEHAWLSWTVPVAVMVAIMFFLKSYFGL